MAEKVILCVDDEDIILESLQEQLARHFGDQAFFEIAENANEAFEILKELQEEGVEISVIVSDWLMPGMKGDEFLIKVHEKFPNIVKVLLTGQANQQAIEKAKQYAGLFAVVQKPWEEQELLHIVKEGLTK